jgi:hypothetical protein
MTNLMLVLSAEPTFAIAVAITASATTVAVATFDVITSTTCHGCCCTSG